MFIDLPVKFDVNEVFILYSLLMVLTVSAFLPKRFTPSEIVYIFIFNFFLAVIVDQIFAVPPYDLYDIMDKAKMDIMDLVIYSLVYPITAYIFFVLADLIGFRRRIPLIAFILGWSAVTLSLEWAASQVGVYKYKGWTYAYSGISYVIVFSINLLVLYFIKQARHKRVTYS